MRPIGVCIEETAPLWIIGTASRLQTLTLGRTACGGKHAVPPPPESLKILTARRDGASNEEIPRRSWPLAYPKEYIERHRTELEAANPWLLDHPIPARKLEFIAERIPGARYQVIPDVDQPFFNQCPDEFLGVFLPFVRSHPLD